MQTTRRRFFGRVAALLGVAVAVRPALAYVGLTRWVSEDEARALYCTPTTLGKARLGSCYRPYPKQVEFMQSSHRDDATRYLLPPGVHR